MTSVCIIGSGAGGGLVALELLSRKKDINIEIVDVDDITKKYCQNNELNFQFESSIRLENTYSKGAGGSTNKWHGVITKFDEHDISLMRINHLFNPYDQIERYYVRLAHYFPNSQKLTTHRDKTASPLFAESEKIKEKHFLVYAFPLRVRKLLRRALKVNTKLTYTGKSVCIGFEHQNNYITAALILNDGKLEKIYADKFILAAGAIENVRILYQTFKLKNETIRPFMDHPIIKIGQVRLPRRKLFKMNGTPGILNRVSERIGYVLTNPKYGSNHSIMFRPSASVLEKRQREIIRSIILNGFSVKSVIQLFKSPMLIQNVFFLALEKFGIAVYTKSLDVTIQIETTTEDDLTVKVGPTLDTKKYVDLSVKYKVPQRIRDDLNDIQKLVQETLKNNANYIPETDWTFYGGAHYSGTCPVNGDDPVFAVNDDLSHKVLKNLHICDGSIFPSIGNSNLVYSIALQAIKLADRIAN